MHVRCLYSWCDNNTVYVSHPYPCERPPLTTLLFCPQNAAMSTAGGSGVTSTSTSKATLKPGTVHVVKPNSKTLPDMIELMVSTSHPPHSRA